MGLKLVKEDNYGLYIWVTDDGRQVADSDGNIMNIPSKEGDLSKMVMIQKAARYYGVEGGRPVFLPGHRRVTDSEYEDQQARLADGLIADPLDYRAHMDEIK